MAKIKIKRIKKADKKALEDINNLLRQWSDKGYQIKYAYFKALVKKSHVLCLYNGDNIIGTVTLIELHKLSGFKGSIEHSIVDENYRGKGLGKNLMNYAIDYARKIGIEALFLTCEPHRIAANELYKKLGFKVKETNFYQLDLYP